MKPIEYHENIENNGSYQYVPLSEIIDDFVYETLDDDSILKNTKRVKIIKHCKSALRTLNVSTFNQSKVMEITVPENLAITVPHDFVALKKVFVTVLDTNTNSYRLRPLNRNNNINISVGVLQNHEGNLLFDVDGNVLNTDGENAYNKPFKKYEFVNGGDDTKVAKYGEYILDENRGKILFSSDLYDHDIVLQYRTDGLSFDTYGEDEIKVHKDMITVLNDLVYYTLINRKQHVSRGAKLDALNRFKTTRHEARLNRLKLNLVEVFRNSRGTHDLDNNISSKPPLVRPTFSIAPVIVPELPTANAGMDQTITLPIDNITLSGGGNTGFGNIISYLWVSSGGQDIINSTSAIASINNLTEGTNTITLTITYADGTVVSDDMIIVINAALDIEAPSIPENLVLTNSTFNANSYVANWDAATDNVSVNLYRLQYTLISDTNWSNVVGVSTVSGTNRSETLPDNDYKFRIKAIDTSGNESEYSSEVVLTIPLVDDEAPTRPNNLEGVVDGYNVTLNWDASTDNVAIENYELEQATFPDTDFVSVTKIITSNLIATVSLANNRYLFRVRAKDTSGNYSPYSFDILKEVSVDAHNPTAPSSLNVTINEDDAELNWIASTDDVEVASYKAFATLESDTDWSNARQAGFTADTTTYTFTGLENGNYKFKVYAIDTSQKESDDSNIATATVNYVPEVATADAGEDQTITYPTNEADLTGVGNPNYDTIDSYVWSTIGSNGITVQDYNTSTPRLLNLKEYTTFQARVTITYADGVAVQDEMRVWIDPSTGTVPFRVVTDDNIVLEIPNGDTTIYYWTLNQDSNSNIYGSGRIEDSMLWSKESGPDTPDFYSADSPGVNVGLQEGTYVFRLTATDDLGNTAFDDITITVNQL